MQIDYEAIGQRIKNARKILGYTQEELATKMNLQQYEISKIETAKKGSIIGLSTTWKEETYERR